MLQSHPLDEVSWHTCVLPTKEHALCLRVPEGTGATDGGNAHSTTRELLLRCKSKEQVDASQALLCVASLEHEQRRQQALVEEGRQRREHPPGATVGSKAAARPGLGRLQLFVRASPPPPAGKAAEDGGSDEASPAPRSISFGSPVAEDAGGTTGMAASVSSSDSNSLCGDGSEGEDGEGVLWHCLQCHLPDGSTASPEPLPAGAGMLARSAPASPLLPGLPLVASPSAAPVRRPSVSAPASPAHGMAPQGRPSATQLASALEQLQPEPPAPPPIRLLSFSGRTSGRRVQTHVQRLEAAVAQLSAELAGSRGGGGSSAASPSRDHATAAAAAAAAAPHAAPRSQPGSQDAGCSAAAAGHPAAADGAVEAAGQGSSSRHLGLVLRENGLLLEQQAALQAVLGRMQGQLAAAAADNVRLAQEAAAAVRQLQAAGEAAQGSQLRERRLAASLSAAVGRCEEVGRELAALSGKVEAKSAQCRELR